MEIQPRDLSQGCTCRPRTTDGDVGITLIEVGKSPVVIESWLQDILVAVSPL